MTKQELIGLMAAIVQAGDLIATEAARQTWHVAPRADNHEPPYPQYLTAEQCVERAQELLATTRGKRT